MMSAGHGTAAISGDVGLVVFAFGVTLARHWDRVGR